MPAITSRSRRPVKPKLVTVVCQYPDDWPRHTFTYQRTTGRPRLYCPEHQKVANRLRAERDADGKVIGHKRVTEKRTEDASFAIGQLRKAGAEWLQKLDLPMLGDLQPVAGVEPLTPGVVYPGTLPDPFKWVVLSEDSSPGVTVSVLELDDKGRPRFGPLYRLLTVEEVPDGAQPLSLDMEVTAASGREATLGDFAALFGMEPVVGSAEVPDLTHLLPGATRLHLAIARVKLKLGRGWRQSQDIVERERRRDPDAFAEVDRQVAEAIALALALMEGEEPVLSVQDSEGAEPTARPKRSQP